MDWSGPGPTPPYVPNWDKTTLRGEWNTRLFELLMEQIREGEVEYDDADIEAMRELFFEKLERVRRLVKEAQPKNGESPTNAQQRSHANHLRKLEGQKLHTRRQTVSVYTKNS